MPPMDNSRYRHSTVFTDTDRRSFLTEPAPIPYVQSRDNTVHIVQAGERLQDLAQRYYADFGDDTFPAAAFWYVIAKFQPVPIVDPTLRLAAGTRLYIPSKRYLAALIRDRSRRDK
jgi:hypothetical protein